METRGGAECFHAFFPVEMTSFVFLSQHRDTKAMLYLFYKLQVCAGFVCHLCPCTLRENENHVKRFSVL